MTLRRTATAVTVVICLAATATAAMYTINNPAEKIDNPAARMENPAARITNPAANIYNPAMRMNEPDPFSPVVQPVPPPAAAEAAPAARPGALAGNRTAPRPELPQKSYNLKTARAYINAAKKAFVRDDYREFLSITEDALRRISAGTLKASRKVRRQLVSYKTFGYGLLEKNAD